MTHLLNQRISERWVHKRPGEVVILDNRDSFVFNLAHRFAQLDVHAVVVRSDSISVDTLREWAPSGLVVSPGPGYPADAGISIDAIRAFSGVIPILGVCLGHQAIGEAFGGRIVPSGRPRHGMSSMITHDGRGVFESLESPMEVGRYHALVIERPLPSVLEVSAEVDGFIMAVRHRAHPTIGVQFHPESVLSPNGLSLLCNWAQMVCI